MTPEQKAAIEEAAKLPTAVAVPKPIGDVLLNVPHVLTQDGAYYHYTAVCSAIESHTAAHTAALRERVKKLESLMQEFVDRVDRGEVRSKKTYAKFKEALK